MHKTIEAIVEADGTVRLLEPVEPGTTRSKRRPALVLAAVGQDDFLLCQITSNPYSDPKAIELSDEDFVEGSGGPVTHDPASSSRRTKA